MNVMPFFVAAGVIGAKKPLTVEAAEKVLDDLRSGEKIDRKSALRAVSTLNKSELPGTDLSSALRDNTFARLNEIGALEDVVTYVAAQQGTEIPGVLQDALREMSPEAVAKTVGAIAKSSNPQSKQQLNQLYACLENLSDDQLVSVARELSGIDTPSSKDALEEVFSEGLEKRELGHRVDTDFEEDGIGIKGFYLDGKDGSADLLAVSVGDRVFGGADPIASAKESQIAQSQVRRPGFIQDFNQSLDQFGR